MGGGNNDESESPGESFKYVYVSLVLLIVLRFAISPQIGQGPERETGVLDKSN